jgi:hypothetical protein
MIAALAAGCVVPAAQPEPRYAGPPGAYGEEGQGEEAEWTAESEPEDGSGPESGPDGEEESGPGPEPEADPDPGPEVAASAAANEGRGAGLTPFEAGVVTAVNRLRRDPRGYAGQLERHRRNYQQNYLYLPGLDAPILTVEGVRAVDEAIAAARRARPRAELRVSPGLSRAARAHAVEIGRAGTVDHDGRDGSQPHQRMERHGRVVGLSGENIGTGWGGPAVMVMSLFIDDGVVGRGHRVNLLESEYRVFGVGCAAHKRFGTVCVLDLAAGYRE